MAVYGHRKTHAQLLARGRDSGRDRPRPGDERHAGIGNPRRAPRQDARHRQVSAGHGRQARPRWGAGSRRWRRTGCTWPTSPTCAWPTARSATRRSPPTCSPAGSSDGRAPPPWTPEELPLQALEQAISWAASHGGTDGLVHHSDHGDAVHQPRVHHQGRGISACFPRPARSATRTTTPWPRAPTARTRPSSSGDASRFRDLRDLELATFRWVSWWNSKRLLPVTWATGHRERTETEYYANQAAQAAPL